MTTYVFVNIILSQDGYMCLVKIEELQKRAINVMISQL